MPRVPDDYALEKASFSLSRLASALQMLRRDEPNLEDVESCILGAISNLAKIASHSTAEDQWTTEDYKLIDERLHEGLEQLQKRWGYIDETFKERQARVYDETFRRQAGEVSRILLESESPSPTRTLLLDFLDSEVIEHLHLLDISRRLEEVTMGQLPWAEFREETLEGLSRYKLQKAE